MRCVSRWRPAAKPSLRDACRASSTRRARAPRRPASSADRRRTVIPRTMSARRAVFPTALAIAALASTLAYAVPLTPEELAKVCDKAEDTSHCGRLVEEVQLKRLPNLAVRDGVNLRVSLFPSGSQLFADTEA